MFKSLTNLHHAYLLVSDPLTAEEVLHNFFEAEGEKLRGSPDYFIYSDELFGISEARSLSVSAIRKAFGTRKVFFIAPERITLEAQNALLKTFEEPVADTHFFLVVRDASVILPTLLSRVEVVSLVAKENQEEAQKFLNFSLKERLSFVKKFIYQEKSLSPFLDNLILVLKKENPLKLEKVYKMRLVSDERGTSSRLILEHLALVL